MIDKKIIDKNPICFQAEKTIGELAGELIKNHLMEIPICDKKRYVGMFSHKSLLKSRINNENKIASLVRKVGAVNMNCTINDIIQVMIDNDMYVVPVTDKDKLIGTISVFNLFKVVERENLLKGVSEILHVPQIVLDKKEPLSKALRAMAQNDLRYFVIASAGKIEDVVTHNQIIKEYYIKDMSRDFGQKPRNKSRAFKAELSEITNYPLENLMKAQQVNIIDNQSTIQRAIDVLIEKRVPVLVSSNLQDVVDVRDILFYLKAQQESDYVPIEFQNLENIGLSAQTKRRMYEIATNSLKVFSRSINNELDLIVHVKKHQGEGKKHRYEINSRVSFPGGTIAANEEEWDVLAALHSSLNDIYNQMINRFKD